VRLSCPCGYRKAYRLARLAEHFGADISLDAVLSNLKLGRCPHWGTDATFCELRCRLKFADIGSDNPPDVPRSAQPPRLLK
jgi:hypothetical protein